MLVSQMPDVGITCGSRGWLVGARPLRLTATAARRRQPRVAGAAVSAADGGGLNIKRGITESWIIS